MNLQLRKKKWYIILAYKNPNVSNALFLKKVTEVYEHLMNKGKEIILLGDLNINMLSEENEIKNNLMDVYDLRNLIIDPTCFKRSGGTLIDPLIVKNRKRFQKPINVFCGFSDLGGLYNKTTCTTTKAMKEDLQIFKIIK